MIASRRCTSPTPSVGPHRRAPSGPRGASDVAHPRQRVAVRRAPSRRSSPAKPHIASPLHRDEELVDERADEARPGRRGPRRPRAPAGAWRRVARRACATRASSRSQPSARACGAHASSSSLEQLGRGAQAVVRRGRRSRRPCRRAAARKRFSSSTSGRVGGSGCSASSARAPPGAPAHWTSATSARGVRQARLRVHDAHLERAELRLQAHVPPQERRLGDRAAAQQHVDRLDVVLVAAEARAGCRCAGRPGRPACAPTPGPLSRPCQNGELADSASSSGRCARMPLNARTADRRRRHRDVHVQREGRLAPRQLAHRVVGSTGSARRGRPRRPPSARTGACPRRPRACRCGSSVVGERRAQRRRARRPRRAAVGAGRSRARAAEPWVSAAMCPARSRSQRGRARRPSAARALRRRGRGA